MTMSRRQAIGTIAGGVGAVMVFRPGMSEANVPAVRPPPVLNDKGMLKHQPLPYEPLDPAYVGNLTYEAFQHGHCMYSVVEGLVRALSEKVGGPYLTWPTATLEYGFAGVNGWGTLCGTMNGAAYAINLASPDPRPLIDELYAWFERTPLPNFVPEKPKFEIQSAVSNSVLCHVSIDAWTKVSGKGAFTPERSDRCGQLAASVAVKVTELLNAQAAGEFVAAYPISEEVQECRSCHTQKASYLENSQSKMDCFACHEKHPL
jgi:hypothetical protein